MCLDHVPTPPRRSSSVPRHMPIINNGTSSGQEGTARPNGRAGIARPSSSHAKFGAGNAGKHIMVQSSYISFLFKLSISCAPLPPLKFHANTGGGL